MSGACSGYAERSRLTDVSQFIEYQLQKYLNFRLADLTHKEVAAMEAEVSTIVAEHLSLAATADGEIAWLCQELCRQS